MKSWISILQVLAWKALAKSIGKEYNKMPVVLENVALHRATILSKTGKRKIVFL